MYFGKQLKLINLLSCLIKKILTIMMQYQKYEKIILLKAFRALKVFI